MDWTLKIIIGLLIINLLWTYYLKKEILNPKRYYLVDKTGTYTFFIRRIRSNGTIDSTYRERPRWRLPDARKVKEVYPYLKIIDCATLEEVEE